MPSAKDLLKKHESRIPKKIDRKGPTRPWQDNLENQSALKDNDKKTSVQIKPSEENSSKLNNDMEGRKGAFAGASGFKDKINFTEYEDTNHKIVVEDSVKLDEIIESNSVENEIKSKILETDLISNSKFPALTNCTHKFELSFELCHNLVKEYGAEKAMYITLLIGIVNERNEIYAAQNKLANLFSVSDRSVKRIIQTLIKSKILDVIQDFDPTTKTPRVYKLNVM